MKTRRNLVAPIALLAIISTPQAWAQSSANPPPPNRTATPAASAGSDVPAGSASAAIGAIATVHGATELTFNAANLAAPPLPKTNGEQFRSAIERAVKATHFTYDAGVLAGKAAGISDPMLDHVGNKGFKPIGTAIKASGAIEGMMRGDARPVAEFAVGECLDQLISATCAGFGFVTATGPLGAGACKLIATCAEAAIEYATGRPPEAWVTDVGYQVYQSARDAGHVNASARTEGDAMRSRFESARTGNLDHAKQRSEITYPDNNNRDVGMDFMNTIMTTAALQTVAASQVRHHAPGPPVNGMRFSPPAGPTGYTQVTTSQPNSSLYGTHQCPNPDICNCECAM